MYQKSFLYILLSLLALSSCCRKLKSKIHAKTIDSNIVHLRLYTYGGRFNGEAIRAENTITAKWGVTSPKNRTV